MSTGYTTYFVAVFALVIYTFYILSTLGVGGLLLSVAIGLIAGAFVDEIEYITAIIILVGLACVVLKKRDIKKGGKEGFVVGEALGTGAEISDRVKSFAPQKRSVSPVLSAGSEGFADLGSKTSDVPPPASTPATTASVTDPNTQTNKDAKEVVDAAATPANSVGATGIKPVASKGATGAGSATEGAPAGLATAATGGDIAASAPSTSGFQNQKNTGLFKLGEMPSEQKNGPFVDAASTLNKAMGSLNTDQMAAMTAESKSLIETQKNLMNMLQSMSPVLQDGRRLLDTFSGIFGGLDGVLPNK